MSHDKLYIELNETEKAFKILDQLLEEFPPSGDNYNAYADNLIKIGDYEKALEFSYKSLELDPISEVNNATLAEIQAYLGNTAEFYRNITIALNLGLSWEDIKKEPIYQKYLKEQKFIDLLARYDIFPDEED